MVLAGLCVGLWAHFRLTGVLGRYLEVPARTASRFDSPLTGAQVAARLLKSHGTAGVVVKRSAGALPDWYDGRAVRLVPGVHDGTSVVAVAVAAHGAGHAMQTGEPSRLLALWRAVVPVVELGSRLSLGLVVVGAFLGQPGGFLLRAGFLVFTALFGCAVAVLPVEFGASRRALAALRAAGLVGPEDLDGVRAVLNAVALAPVAASVSALIEVWRGLFRGPGRWQQHW